MYISKNDLIKRLVAITGKDRKEFLTMTVEALSNLYKSYVDANERIYIHVPYKDKNLAKLLGAQYDGENKKWFIPPGVSADLFKKWLIVNDSEE